MSGEDSLVIKSEDKGVLVLTLNNPPLNILNMKMMRELTACLLENENRKIILIKARGKVFCAGADVGEHIGDKAKEMISDFHAVFRALGAHRGLSVAVVEGPALGGGCELAAFCDVVLAGANASFGQPESLVGVFPPVAAALWPRLMGERKALEYILSGEKISADRALELGLVNRVFLAENLDAEVDKFLTQFKTKSLIVIDHVKRAVKLGGKGAFFDALGDIEELYLESLMKTHDADEGLRAFMEKRKPEWRDE